MLEYTSPREPTAVDAPLIVLLHGRGATRADLLPLADYMPQHANVVFPEAPFAAAPWGYGPGSAWYRFLGGDKPEPESFSRSLDELRTLIGSFAARSVVVGGFSQGGTLGIGYALAHPGTVAGVLNFSGFLPDHPDVSATPQNVADTAFFWAHGRHDRNIPFPLAVQGRAILQQAGANLTVRDYDMGHWIEPQELQDAVAWLKQII